MATTGETKSTIGKVFTIHMAVWEITNDIHDVARSRPWFFLSENAESQQRTAGVPRGLFRVWSSAWPLLVAFSCVSSLSWPLWVVVFSGLFALVSVSAFVFPFRRHSYLVS